MSTEKPYPIVLSEVLFTKACVVAIPGHEPSAESMTVSPENSITVSPDPERPHHFVATMRTLINKERSADGPYFIEMECIAVLSTDGTLAPEDEIRGVTINAHSVCYGAIRESVAWMTSRQPYGLLSLGLSVLRPQKRTEDEVIAGKN